MCDLRGIPALVQLFSSANRAVLRYATGATRNLIYENSDNKAALVDAGGVARLVSILSEADEELRKTVTGNIALISLSSPSDQRQVITGVPPTPPSQSISDITTSNVGCEGSRREVPPGGAGLLGFLHEFGTLSGPAQEAEPTGSPPPPRPRGKDASSHGSSCRTVESTHGVSAGVLWNLSSRDNLKEKLSREALCELTDKVLVPLCNSTPLNASEREIFYNTTGCLR